MSADEAGYNQAQTNNNPSDTLDIFMGLVFRCAIIVSVATLIGTTAPSTAVSAAEAQEESLRTHRFTQDKYTRRYKFYTPKGAEQLEGERPLVLVIHGGGSTDRGMIKLTKNRWHELADKHGFYVAYPNAAHKKTWDFGEGKISERLKKRVDDLAYFERVIDEVSSRVNIDQRRVFATGISRGGQASFFLACNLSERIRAVAPVAMGLPAFMVNECETGPPVAVAIMNGTKDPQVPFNGGEITVFRKQRGVVLSASDTVKLWRTRNGCMNTPSTVHSIDESNDNTSVEISSWVECSGAPVWFFKIINGGHTWPGGLQYLSPRIVGHTSYDIDGSKEAWRFFSQF